MPLTPANSPRYRLERGDFDRLLARVRQLGYDVMGPRVRDGAVMNDEISRAADLPVGWTEEQIGGAYRLKRREDEALFGFAVGPDSWKKFLFPPRLSLWNATRNDESTSFSESNVEPRKLAFIGVRSCDLHAIAVQDRVFVKGQFVDPHYKAQRERLCLIAVNCGNPGGACFCVSMGTGPRAEGGFDLALTEVLESGRHFFVVDVGSELGTSILAPIPHGAATSAEVAAADAVVAGTQEHMGRAMDTRELPGLLRRNHEHPRWTEVASRCLACGNCTLVCPTCFCSSIEDTTDLTGQVAERSRRWESCFTTGHSYIHGGSVRPGSLSRYRQWMTHKLDTWWDQFDMSGCVGCGRCITWCPVGIDITEEVAAIRADDHQVVQVTQGGNRGDA